MPLNSLVVYLWIRSNWLISSTRFGKQADTPHSKCGRTNAPYNGTKLISKNFGRSTLSWRSIIMHRWKLIVRAVARSIWIESYQGLSEIKLAKFFQVTCKSDDESGHFMVYIQLGIHQYVIQQEIRFCTKFIDRKNMTWRSIGMRLVDLRLPSLFLTY